MAITDLGTATARMVVDSSGVKKGSREGADSFERALSRMQRTARDRTRAIGDSFSRAGQKMAVLSLAAGAAFTFGIKSAADFEIAMAAISSRTGILGEQLDELGQVAKDMGRDTVFSASQAADALLQLTTSGQTAAEAVALIPDVLNLAAAASTDIGFAADVVTDILNQFQLEVTNSTLVIDALHQASATSSATVNALADGFKNSGAAAQAFGLSVHETAAALAILNEAGVKDAEAGTKLTRTLLNITRQTKKVTSAWAELGTSYYDTAGKARDFDTVLKELKLALSTKTEQDKTRLLTDLGGTYGFIGLSALTAAGGIAKQRERMEEATSAAQVAADMMDTFAQRLNSLKGSIETLLIEAFTPFMEDNLKPLINLTIEIVNSMAEWVKVNPALTKWMVILTGAVALLAPALLAMGVAFGAIASAIPIMVTGFALLTGPLATIAAGVAVFSVAVATNFLFMRDILGAAFRIIGSILNNISNAMKVRAAEIGGFVSTLRRQLTDANGDLSAMKIFNIDVADARAQGTKAGQEVLAGLREGMSEGGAEMTFDGAKASLMQGVDVNLEARAGFTDYKVKQDDTLWDIFIKSGGKPAEWKDWIAAVAKLNPDIDVNVIGVGMSVKLPVALSAEINKVDVVAKGGTTEYKMKSGDSFWGIFISQGGKATDWAGWIGAVRKINPDIDASMVQTGTTVRIPVSLTATVDSVTIESTDETTPVPDRIETALQEYIDSMLVTHRIGHNLGGWLGDRVSGIINSITDSISSIDELLTGTRYDVPGITGGDDVGHTVVVKGLIESIGMALFGPQHFAAEDGEQAFPNAWKSVIVDIADQVFNFPSDFKTEFMNKVRPAIGEMGIKWRETITSVTDEITRVMAAIGDPFDLVVQGRERDKGSGKSDSIDKPGAQRGTRKTGGSTTTREGTFGDAVRAIYIDPMLASLEGIGMSIVATLVAPVMKLEGIETWVEDNILVKLREFKLTLSGLFTYEPAEDSLVSKAAAMLTSLFQGSPSYFDNLGDTVVADLTTPELGLESITTWIEDNILSKIRTWVDNIKTRLRGKDDDEASVTFSPAKTDPKVLSGERSPFESAIREKLTSLFQGSPSYFDNLGDTVVADLTTPELGLKSITTWIEDNILSKIRTWVDNAKTRLRGGDDDEASAMLPKTDPKVLSGERSPFESAIIGSVGDLFTTDEGTSVFDGLGDTVVADLTTPELGLKSITTWIEDNILSKIRTWVDNAKTRLRGGDDDEASAMLPKTDPKVLSGERSPFESAIIGSVGDLFTTDEGTSVFDGLGDTVAGDLTTPELGLKSITAWITDNIITPIGTWFDEAIPDVEDLTTTATTLSIIARVGDVAVDQARPDSLMGIIGRILTRSITTPPKGGFLALLNIAMPILEIDPIRGWIDRRIIKPVMNLFSVDIQHMLNQLRATLTGIPLTSADRAMLGAGAQTHLGGEVGYVLGSVAQIMVSGIVGGPQGFLIASALTAFGFWARYGFDDVGTWFRENVVAPIETLFDVTLQDEVDKLDQFLTGAAAPDPTAALASHALPAQAQRGIFGRVAGSVVKALTPPADFSMVDALSSIGGVLREKLIVPLSNIWKATIGPILLEAADIIAGRTYYVEQDDGTIIEVVEDGIIKRFFASINNAFIASDINVADELNGIIDTIFASLTSNEADATAVSSATDTALTTIVDSIRSLFPGAVEIIESVGTAFMELFVYDASDTQAAAGTTGYGVGEVVGNFVGSLLDLILDILFPPAPESDEQEDYPMLHNIVGGILNALGAGVNFIKNLVGGVIDGLLSSLAGGDTTIGQAVASAGPVLAGFATDVVTGVEDALIKEFNRVFGSYEATATVPDEFDPVKGIINSIHEGMSGEGNIGVLHEFKAGALQTLFDNIVGGIETAINNAVPGIRDAWDTVSGTFTDFIASVVKEFDRVFGSYEATATIPDEFDPVKGIINSIHEGMSGEGNIGVLHEFKAGVLQTRFDNIVGGIATAINNAVPGIRDAWDTVSGTFTDFIASVVKEFNRVFGSYEATATVPDEFDPVKGIINSIHEGMSGEGNIGVLREFKAGVLQTRFDNIVGGIETAINNAAGGIKDAWDTVSGTFTDFIASVVGEDGSMSEDGEWTAGSGIMGLASFIRQVITGGVTWVSTNIVDPLASLVTAIKDGLQPIIDFVLEDVLPPIKAIVTAVQDALKALGLLPGDGNPANGGMSAEEEIAAAPKAAYEDDYYEQRDRGGPGYPGMPYVITPKAAPEIFIPQTRGQFYPNADKLMGDTYTINITPPTDKQGNIDMASAQQYGRLLLHEIRRS